MTPSTHSTLSFSILDILNNYNAMTQQPIKFTILQNIFFGPRSKNTTSTNLTSPSLTSLSFNILLLRCCDFLHMDSWTPSISTPSFTTRFSTIPSHRHSFTCVAASSLRCQPRHRHSSLL